MATTKYIGEEALIKVIELTKAADAEIEEKKVDKVEGMGLSHNDLTDEIIAKIESSNNITSDIVSELGTITEIKEKLDKAGTVDEAAISQQIKDEVNSKLADVTGLEFVPINEGEELPVEGEAGKIYLVPNEAGTDNAYQEYVWVGDSYELLGSSEIDLSGYMKSTDLEEITGMNVEEYWQK